jgi:hypothetical protein
MKDFFSISQAIFLLRETTCFLTKPEALIKTKCIKCHITVTPMGLYHQLDGDTNLKYKLLGFLTPNKKISKRKGQYC